MDEYQNKELTQFAFRKRWILKDFDDGKFGPPKRLRVTPYTPVVT